MKCKEDQNAPLNPTTTIDSSQVLVGSVCQPKEVINNAAQIKQNTTVNEFFQDLVGSVRHPKLDLNNFAPLNHNSATIELARDKINLPQGILEVSQSNSHGKDGFPNLGRFSCLPPLHESIVHPVPPISMEGMGATLGDKVPKSLLWSSGPPLDFGVIAPVVSTPINHEEDVLIQQVKELLHNEPFRECGMPQSLHISPNEHMAQQVELLLKSNMDLIEEEVSEKVLCSLGNDLDFIHKSLPFSPSLNPSEVPINSPPRCLKSSGSSGSGSASSFIPSQNTHQIIDCSGSAEFP